MKQNQCRPYDDIIHLLHPVSTKHPQMPVADRAAQFSPFAALTGHDAAIKETARLTDERIELDEEEKLRLDDKLRMVQEMLTEQPELLVTYFQADNSKSGGSYLTVRGCVKKINVYEQVLVLTEGVLIPIGDIYELEGKVFSMSD
jgi:hypothetical protein